MPIHDWTQVDAGLFHAFHHDWITALGHALNQGVLPAGYFALPEQRMKGPIADVLTLKLSASVPEPTGGTKGLAVATAPPKTRYVHRTEPEIYAGLAKRIVVRHQHG